MRYKATSELIQEAVHAWLCSAPLPNHIRLFDVIDVYESGGLWGFTHQGKHYKLRPLQRATEIAVSLPRPDLYGRSSHGECIVNALGCTRISDLCGLGSRGECIVNALGCTKIIPKVYVISLQL